MFRIRNVLILTRDYPRLDPCIVIASAAKQSRAAARGMEAVALDCFVAALLAMTLRKAAGWRSSASA